MAVVAMETGALSDILERIQSPSGNADGLLRLREWLQDSRNIARAAAEVEMRNKKKKRKEKGT